MKVNLIMPMGGAGTRFAEKGYELPKPMMDLNGIPFFYWASQSLMGHMDIATTTFVILKEHADKYELDDKIKSYFSDANIVYLDEVLNGAVMTCLEGVKTIGNDYPVIFCDCDLMFVSDALYDYYKEDTVDAEGTIVTFKSSEDRFSYVRLGDDGYVVETAEKEVISDNAICGAYGFANKDIFMRTALKYMSKCPYDEYYMSGLFNILIAGGMKVRSFEVDEMVSFGTPEEYEVAKDILT